MKLVLLREDEREMLLGLALAASKRIKEEIRVTTPDSPPMHMALETRKVIHRSIDKLAKADR